jgi:hypothetical protein
MIDGGGGGGGVDDAPVAFFLSVFPIFSRETNGETYLGMALEDVCVLIREDERCCVRGEST